MTSNRSKEWEDELWEVIQKIHKEHRAINPMMQIFIRKLLTRQRAEIIEKVEGLPNYEMSPVKRKKVALSDVIKLLKGEE